MLLFRSSLCFASHTDMCRVILVFLLYVFACLALPIVDQNTTDLMFWRKNGTEWIQLNEDQSEWGPVNDNDTEWIPRNEKQTLWIPAYGNDTERKPGNGSDSEWTPGHGNDTEKIRERQLHVLQGFVQELSEAVPYLTERSIPRYPYYSSGGCTPCSARRPPKRRPPTESPKHKYYHEEMPEGVQMRVKEKNKMVFVQASPPSSEFEMENGTIMLSQPVAKWFERKSSQAGPAGHAIGGSIHQDQVQEAEGHTIYIIDNERDAEYFDKKEELSHYDKKLKEHGDHLDYKLKHLAMKKDHMDKKHQQKGWPSQAFSRWRARSLHDHDDDDYDHDPEDEECVYLLLCMIGVNPNDFGRVGQDVNNFLIGPQTDVFKTFSRYVTALRIGTESSSYNINNPCAALSSKCMHRVAPAVPFWPFTNDDFSS